MKISKQDLKRFFTMIYEEPTSVSCKVAGVDQRTVRKWLAGDHVPSDEAISRAIAAMGPK